MPPRSRNTTAALRVSAILCVLATWSLCACAPAGDVGAAATTTEDDGLYKAPPPGEDGAYLPEPEEQQTLEEKMQQSDDGAYHPEKYETPAPEAAQDWDRYWTEGSVTAGGDCATPSEETSEASDDGSYRPEHHKGEDFDERADSGQNSVTPPVEPTEASDDGSYRPEQHTETPAEDYDERADNGTDWRDNVVEQHDEGTEAADDGSYRPQEHGARERRAASEDTEEVQLSPVVFHVGPKPASDVSAKASGSVSDDDASAGPPQSANLPLPAPSV
ncbi:retinitis pigmentosa 1-like 1 protein isoform X3 [Schistocerca piceifrons]|uniref:retinitis pigmentosa 1-like 1 protein isoform X3 n=1 Tax=Schistocerca piceifrons TaxID=274613 RepID=UPI001F5E7D84|nr:retinitis pigmentosa 1-like 1 protein isoform X3 [Schistocerca piceifrons]